MRLHADVHGDPTNPRVVLIHGFTQTGRSWAPLIPRLMERHHVVAVDAPGHGDSSDHHADLVEGARLLGRTGGRASYIGYSMGGRLALHLAVDQPDLVERMVLVGATAGLDTEAERAERRRADEILADDLERNGLEAFLDRWLANPLFATLPAPATALQDRKRNTVDGLAASLRLTGTGTQQPLWDHLPTITTPALLVAGERDEKFKALAHRMAAAWGGPATVTLLPNAGHACHLEQPDAFLDAVLPFLDERTDHRTSSPAASSNP